MNRKIYLLCSILCFATLCVGMVAKQTYARTWAGPTLSTAPKAVGSQQPCTFQVNFVEGNLKVATENAQKSHKKLLFAATDSRQCGSCDVLACDIFNNPEVVGFLNQNFVNLNLDLDDTQHFHLRGSQELGLKPAFLFFTTNGYLVDKVTEIKDAKDLIAQAGKVLERYQSIDIVNLQSDRDKYTMGERDPEFLHDLAFKMKAAGYYYNTIVADYFKTQTVQQLQSPKNRTFIYEFSDNVENTAIDNFLIDLSYFKSVLGSDRANEHVKMAVRNSIEAAITDRDQNLFAKARVVSEKTYLPNIENFMYHIQSEYYEGIGDWDNFVRISTKYVQDYKVTDPQFLNTVSLKYFLFVADRKKLKNAEEWLLKSIEIESEYHNNFLLARLYRKMGECKKARDYAVTAIDIAKIRTQQGTPTDYNEAGKFLNNLATIGCSDPEP